MNGRDKRRKRAERARNLPAIKRGVPLRACLHCGEMTREGHFVPPSFGDRGFYICAAVGRHDILDPDATVTRRGVRQRMEIIPADGSEPIDLTPFVASVNYRGRGA